MPKEPTPKRHDRLRLGNVSDDERHAAWTRVIERIYTEQVNQAWSDYMFRLLRAVFVKNEGLSEEGGFIFDWIAENYAATALMLLRRELDKQTATENLRNLLFDIIEHPNVLSRARYRASWGDDRPVDQGRVDRVFDFFEPKRVPDNPEQDYIDPDVVQADLDQVVGDVERIREFAERTRAHRSPERNFDTSDITFQALGKAIADVRRVVKKYYALLTLKSISRWEPVPQYNTLAPFTKPWVIDHKEVKAEVKKGDKEKLNCAKQQIRCR